MTPDSHALARLQAALHLDAPPIAVYVAPPEAFPGPVMEASGRACLFAFHGRWLKGEAVAFRRGGGGCPGAHSAFGMRQYPDYMAHFLTDGVGAPQGEGLKVSAALAQAFLDRATPPPVEGDTVLVGPLHLELWPHVRSVTWLVDPDRLSALMTLAGYWTGETDDAVQAPFSSGCGLMWRSMLRDDRPVVGATDIAMRRYLPPDLMAFSVTPARFQRLLQAPDDCFLFKDWWGALARARGWARG